MRQPYTENLRLNSNTPDDLIRDLAGLMALVHVGWIALVSVTSRKIPTDRRYVIQRASAFTGAHG